jgi:hypothetical protein
MAFAATLSVSIASAQTIVQVTSGTATSTQFFGESFTTPSGGPWNNITFNFYATPAVGVTPASTPTAVGNAFLLTQQYLGTPAALSASTPGFVAESTSIAGGMYIFAAGVTLSPNTQYWIYENADMLTSGSGTGGAAAASAYFAPTATSNFNTGLGTEISNFLVAGTANLPTTPVPPSFLLTMAGLGCMGLYQAIRRARRSSSY